MAKIEIDTYVLPAFWASALINADTSGMNDDDEIKMNNWLDSVKPGYCVGCDIENTWFEHNIVINLGCDVTNFHFHKS